MKKLKKKLEYIIYERIRITDEIKRRERQMPNMNCVSIIINNSNYRYPNDLNGTIKPVINYYNNNGCVIIPD